MKKVTMSVPDGLASFLKKHKLTTREEVASYAMFLFPFIYDEKLTFGEAAMMMGISEESLRTVYDYYNVNEGIGSGMEYLDDLKKQFP